MAGRKKEEIVIKENPYVVHSKERALKLSVAEGSAQAVSNNLGGTFITPFALAIGGNSFHVGMLSSAAGLFSPIGQLKGSDLMEKYSRKKILLKTKIFINLCYLGIISLVYLYMNGLIVNYLPYALVVLWGILVNYFFGIGYVSWFSWMGDLVPSGKKGEYFAKRNKVVGFVGLVTFIVGAFLLDVFKTRGYVLLGFTILFGTAVLFRIISRGFMKRIFNPDFRVGKGYYFSFRDFIKRYDNFGKFSFYQAFFFFAIMISSPFFAVYMLENLNFNYVTYTVISMSSVLFYLLLSPLAGKFSDRYGNVKLLYVSGILFPFVPLLWIFFKTPLLLFLIPGFVSGIANAAFTIGTTNFYYDSVAPQKRGLCVAYTSLLIGIGTVFGSLIGGYLIQYVSFSFISSIFFVFILSSLLMVFASLFFLPQIKEERSTQKMRGFKVDFHHPLRMVNSDVVWFKNFIHGR